MFTGCPAKSNLYKVHLAAIFLNGQVGLLWARGKSDLLDTGGKGLRGPALQNNNQKLIIGIITAQKYI